MCGKNTHFANVFGDPIALALFEEMPLQSHDRRVGLNGIAVEASAGDGDGAIIYIGGEDRHLSRGFRLRQRFSEQDGERIGLLACRAARDPDADRVFGPPLGNQIRDDGRGQGFKHGGVTEETGYADQDFPEQEFRFGRAFA